MFIFFFVNNSPFGCFATLLFPVLCGIFPVSKLFSLKKKTEPSQSIIHLTENVHEFHIKQKLLSASFIKNLQKDQFCRTDKNQF